MKKEDRDKSNNNNSNDDRNDVKRDVWILVVVLGRFSSSSPPAVCDSKLFVDLVTQNVQEFDGLVFLAEMGLPSTTDLCIFGTTGDDSITGGDGDDIIITFKGRDTIYGGDGSVRRSWALLPFLFTKI